MQKGFTLIELMIVVAIIGILLRLRFLLIKTTRSVLTFLKALVWQVVVQKLLLQSIIPLRVLPNSNANAGLPTAASIKGNAVRSKRIRKYYYYYLYYKS
jgi:prepilin-type N-terminal cleavage/methylation domain-containing protein